MKIISKEGKNLSSNNRKAQNFLVFNWGKSYDVRGTSFGFLNPELLDQFLTASLLRSSSCYFLHCPVF